MEKRSSRVGRLIRSCVLALSVLLIGYLVGVGAATLAERAGVLGAPVSPQGEDDAQDVPNEPTPAASDSFTPAVASYSAWDPESAPNYYRVTGASELGEAPEAGTFVYGHLDALGRATGVEALITYDAMQAGRSRSREDISMLEPSGWGHNAEVDIAMPDGTVYHGQFYNRSHLVAKSLGGDDGLHNLVTATRTQNVGANLDGHEGGMAYAEGLARSWLERNQEGTVHYRVTPLYEGDELVARSIIVDVRTSDGSIDQRVEVYNAALGFDIDYATGEFQATGDARQLAAGVGGSGVDEEAEAPSSNDSVEPTGSSDPVDGERKVIVTGSGEAYHHDETCPGLANARTMEWVTVSEAEDMGRHPCGICGG